MVGGLLWWAFVMPAPAADVGVTVVDATGALVSHAVVALRAIEVSRSIAPHRPQIRGAVLDEVGQQLVPHVLAIQAGGSLAFPNSGGRRHQLYSFAEAKRFELDLNPGGAPALLTFEVPGVIVIGCNLHAWMSAYLYVLDTPLFALTDAAGYAALDAPPGVYALEIWHPRHARGREPLRTEVRIERELETFKQTLPLAAGDDAGGAPRS